MNHRDQVIFEHLARSQTGYCYVLLAIVGVDRRFALYRRAQVLHRILTGFDDGPVCFEDPDIRNLHTLVGRVVAHLQLAPLLHASLALHSYPGDRLPAASAVGLETIAGM